MATTKKRQGTRSLAPVLATGISGDASTGLITPLIVGDTLPSVVRDYLATPVSAPAATVATPLGDFPNLN
ncbi:MAG: hypothetical protein OXB99_05130 [Acidimicrobiaceae bacterium]|nr:hypothetical protein [Acidimicrobiaceae bacterium]